MFITEDEAFCLKLWAMGALLAVLVGLVAYTAIRPAAVNLANAAAVLQQK